MQKQFLFLACQLWGGGIKAQNLGTWYQSGSTTPSSISTQSPFALKWGVNFTPTVAAWADIDYNPPVQGIDQKGILLTRHIPNNYIQTSPGLGIPSYKVVSFMPLGSYISTTGSISVVAGANGKTEPMFWIRSQAQAYSNGQPPPMNISSPGYDETKLIVLPNGNIGINNGSPRAALDVLTLAGVNQPCAIFGALSNTASGNIGEENIPGIGLAYTRHLEYVPQLDVAAYNPVSLAGDHGLFYSDGAGPEGSNASSSLVIAPFSANAAAGGLRLDALGNLQIKGNTIVTGDILMHGKTEMRGELLCNGLKSKPKWWPDFVFAKDYNLLCLDSLSAFITQNHHLPGMPSQSDVLEKGQDVLLIQQLQLQKIEELTLYIISLEKRYSDISNRINELEKKKSKSNN